MQREPTPLTRRRDAALNASIALACLLHGALFMAIWPRSAWQGPRASQAAASMLVRLLAPGQLAGQATAGQALAPSPHQAMDIAMRHKLVSPPSERLPASSTATSPATPQATPTALGPKPEVVGQANSSTPAGSSGREGAAATATDGSDGGPGQQGQQGQLTGDQATAPDFAAAYLHNPRPPYPVASRAMGEQGRTLLAVQVGADGTALAVTLNQSSGSNRLDEAAIVAVRHWRFTPARRGDQAIEGTVIVPVVFTLH